MDMPFITRYSMTFPYISCIWAWVKMARQAASQPAAPNTAEYQKDPCFL